MSQQINLCSPIFRKQEKHFSAQAMLISAAIVAGALAALYAYSRVQTAAIVRQADEVEAQRARVLAQVIELAKGDNTLAKRKEIEDSIKRAEARLAARERLATAIPEAGSGGQAFSDLLTALARRTMEGVWLVRVELAAADGAILLAGRARSADLIPAYLARLREEPALAGRSFGKLQVAAAAPRPGEAKARDVAAPYVEFTLGVPVERAAGSGETK